MGLFKKILNVGEGRKLKLLESIVPEVAALEPEMERAPTTSCARSPPSTRQRVADGEDLDDLLPEAFADRPRGRPSACSASATSTSRSWAAPALHFGWVAEMKTGEGKTLVSTLPAYLNALAGKGVHLVTTNDYLAKRDAEWMGQVHQFLGLEVGVVLPEIDDPELKRQAYAADITYGTNNEFGFDYLRDNMAGSRRGAGASAATSSRSSTRSTRSSSTRRGRRSSSRAAPTTRSSSTSSSPAS